MTAPLETAREEADRRDAGLRPEPPRVQQKRIERAFNRGRFSLLPGLAVIAIVWATALAYWWFMPPSYTSRWSLIVPISNSSSSMTLESIGQAQTAPTQPFGTSQLSPKVIYKEIATSDQLRDRAARVAGLDPRRFGKPRVRLVDETPLLNFQISGSTAEEAQAKGRALIEALNQQLDQLRVDEFERRAALVRDNLRIYQASVDRARERIAAFQQATGLLSVQQFTEAASTAEMMRRRFAEKRAEVDKASSELERLTQRAGIGPKSAAAVLRVAADPSFAQLSLAYAEANASLQENRLGPNHPQRVAAQLKQRGSMDELERIARDAGVDAPLEAGRLALFVNDSHYIEMLRQLVSTDAGLKGLRQEVEALEAEIRAVDTKVARMGGDAARLEALKKDHLVAEAVYSSAAARLDTNRTDLFSSYPLVQVLAEPDLAESRSQPRLIYSLAAGTAGTLIVFIAWGALWVRSMFVRRRRRNG